MCSPSHTFLVHDPNFIQSFIKTDQLPIKLMKAMKNPVERQGMRNAHVSLTKTFVEIWVPADLMGIIHIVTGR